MKNLLISISMLLLMAGCQTGSEGGSVLVSTSDELTNAIGAAEPGTTIVMANGEWNDIQIRLKGVGTKNSPITLKAETPGEVIVQGNSDLKLGGAYLVVDGLHFANGASPSGAVIQFSIDDDNLANNSRVTNCVIQNFNKSQRNKSDLWVQFRGRHNQLDHSYLAGKSNRGPTIRVDLEGNESIYNYHKINNNHFGPRPPKGGPSAETIQIGNSSTSMTPSYTQVFNNLFDRCSGEVEVISSKSNFNEFRNNVFYKSEGSLVTRHGNYCTIDGNYFIGDENSAQVGGVRLIGTGHWVTNNYFYNLKGEIFRAPIAVMNGIPRSSINRYIQVTDVNIAYNTFVNCVSPWQFGVGSNVDQKDVLPASEIRSLTPTRTMVANNLIYNDKGDLRPIFRHDSIGGIDFRSNLINNQGVDFRGVKGLEASDFSMKSLEENVWIPANAINQNAFLGFEYDQIDKDLFGKERQSEDGIGAVITGSGEKPNIMDLSKYGPDWFNASPVAAQASIRRVATVQELVQAVEMAESGDVISLAEGKYEINSSIPIQKNLTIQPEYSGNKVEVIYNGNNAPLFEMHPGGDLHLKSVTVQGNGKNIAFAPLRENMSSLYNLKVEGSSISNFDFVLKAYKYSFSQFISFENTTIKDCKNGLELSAEDDDRGEYNAENVAIVDCQFQGVKKNVVDYYRGGYDESTVGGNLLIKGSTFTDCGKEEENGVLINTYGVINVEIVENRFRDNQVSLVARLWGAKNNQASNNELVRSGRIVTEQNLPLKLMY